MTSLIAQLLAARPFGGAQRAISVEQVSLDVENLHVCITFNARLANLLQLTAGADASIDKVKLEIRGVRAEVLLKVRLDNVAAIIEHVDHHRPQSADLGMAAPELR